MREIFRVIAAIVKFILWIIVIGLLAITLTQRLTNNEKSIAGFRLFSVVTKSMVPEYNVGDAIFVKHTEPEKLEVGDDVSYLGKEGSFKDKVITHRIIKKEKNKEGTYTFQTKGIANEAPDPEINESQIYGKVIYKTKTISYINGIIGNLYGMYFVIIVPMAIMIFFEFSSFGRHSDDDDERKERKRRRNKEKDIEEENSEEKDEQSRTEDEIRERRKKRRNRRRERRKNI